MLSLSDSTAAAVTVDAKRPRRVLLVTADDLGYAPERDAGIIHGFEHGVITQASVSERNNTNMLQRDQRQTRSHSMLTVFPLFALCWFVPL